MVVSQVKEQENKIHTCSPEFWLFLYQTALKNVHFDTYGTKGQNNAKQQKQASK